MLSVAVGILLLVASSAYASSKRAYCHSDDFQDFAYRVPEHSCPCNRKTAGTLRYHNDQIQFCNGKVYVNMGGHNHRGELGSESNPADSCHDILAANSKAKSGVYYLNLGGEVTKTYCYMDEMCGSRGWAMIMKIDGSKATFSYNSPKWTDKHPYNEAAAAGGLDNQETKLETYHNLAFTKLCLGLKTNGITHWLDLSYKANSLYSVIHDNVYKPTHLGRNAWKSLIRGSSLQRNCNREGFNVKQGDASMARIGIISNQENDCHSPDSRIGFGTSGSWCGQNKHNSAGNEARCHPDNGDKSTKSFGYIFAQPHVGGSDLGSHDNPASSCRAIHQARRSSKNGVYYLKLRGRLVKTFCVMDNICGSRGWTMVMKINGGKTTFGYNSAYWKNKAVYNPSGAVGGLDDQETKLATYSDLSFKAICLGMKTGHTKRWLRLPQSGSSLYSLISDDRQRAVTRLGRNKWKTLVPGSSLQPHCNREGFNVRHGDAAMARIGIISNQENDCNSPDSRIGFGTGGSWCHQNKDNTAGNEARCGGDNGNKSIRSTGYIFVQ